MATGWQTWKRVARRPLQVTMFNGMRFHAHPDCTSSSSLIYSRVPHLSAINFLRSNVNGGTFVDVGANVGLMSMLLADKVQHALLFEPNPLAAERARQNIATNRLSFEVYESALSDAEGFVSFEDLGGVNTCNRTVIGFEPTVSTRTVPRTRLDEFLRTLGPLPAPVSAVKIDVEGHENAVLRGMTGLLGTERPRMIMFEYLRRTNLCETFQIFDSVGYKVVALSEQGAPVPATLDTPPLQDLFAHPREQEIKMLDAVF